MAKKRVWKARVREAEILVRRQKEEIQRLDEAVESLKKRVSAGHQPVMMADAKEVSEAAFKRGIQHALNSRILVLQSMQRQTELALGSVLRATEQALEQTSQRYDEYIAEVAAGEALHKDDPNG